MIGLERVDPADYAHLDRYAELLESSKHVPEVADHLPEIFEEGSLHRIQEGIRSTGAMRYFVVIDDITVGRTELTRHLNADPSITPRVPGGVMLGFNTCYFINPAKLGRNHDNAHRLVADVSIREAFSQGDATLVTSPWLPISLDGTDVSRGWLMQDGNPIYSVQGDEPQAGIFPQFGIGDNEYSIQYAKLVTT
jgi:hypothetical protein